MQLPVQCLAAAQRLDERVAEGQRLGQGQLASQPISAEPGLAREGAHVSLEVELPGALVTSFTGIDEGTDALADNKIDIFIHDAPTIWRLAANTATQKAGLMGLYRPLTDEYLAWAVRLQDAGLANALNQSLTRLKNDGTLGQVLGKWIPVQVKVRN